MVATDAIRHFLRLRTCSKQCIVYIPPHLRSDAHARELVPECSISQRGDAIRLRRTDNRKIFVEDTNMQRAGRFITEVKPTSSTGDGEVVYELRLEKEHCDSHGHLHAGMAFALVDLYTWTTACTRYDPDTPFVSLNLKARY
ncbi:hypothetical protein MTO96_033255 [Rhipicephalus appendiculatus]